MCVRRVGLIGHAGIGISGEILCVVPVACWVDGFVVSARLGFVCVCVCVCVCDVLYREGRFLGIDVCLVVHEED